MKQILFRVEVVNDPVNLTQKLLISDFANSDNLQPRVKFLDTEKFRIQAVSKPFLESCFTPCPSKQKFDFSVSQIRDYAQRIKFDYSSDVRIYLFPVGFSVEFVKEDDTFIQRIHNIALDLKSGVFYTLDSEVPTSLEDTDKFISSLNELR